MDKNEIAYAVPVKQLKAMRKVIEAAREYRQAEEMLADAVGEDRPGLIGIRYDVCGEKRAELDKTILDLEALEKK